MGFKVIEVALKLLGVLSPICRRLTSPISVEVSYFQFEDFSIHASDGVAMITSYPKRYHVKLVLTNRSDRRVYVISYAARVGDIHAFQQTRFDRALCLEAHEPKEKNIVLPLDAGSEPIRTGLFSVSVWPSFGRRTKVSGLFPVG